MKSKLLIAACLGVAIVACHKETTVVTPVAQTKSTVHHSSARFIDSTDTVSSLFITENVANTMISSYLASINSAANDTDVRSFSINADSLRAYLADNSIKNVKLMFAHTMGYINAGNTGVYAGYQSGALTIIIAAYDASGNYVYYSGNVLDHCAPCPYSCPSGNAGSSLLE